MAIGDGGSPVEPEAPPLPSELRIVLLGKAGAETNRVAKVILGDTAINKESKECVLYEAEQAGRRICLVDTPGWVSTESTAQKGKNEIARSVTLCPPGPHALVLVLPVNSGDVPSLDELESASRHVEQLSERVWKYTMVLFLSNEVVEESTIKEHIQKAEGLLKKCSGRHCVMCLNESETQVHELLEKINNMVKENLDDFFLQPGYYEVIQSKLTQAIKELEKGYEDKVKTLKQEYSERPMCEEQTNKPLRRRRDSISERIRPNFSEDENQAVGPSASSSSRSKDLDEILAFVKYYFKPISLLMLAVIGALIGSVVGSDYGVVGSGIGIIIGAIVTIPLSLCLIKATSLARQNEPLCRREKKSEHTD